MLETYKETDMIPLEQIEESEKCSGLLEQRVVTLLSEQNLHICCAESCTGGLLSASLIHISGASDVLNEGYITYSNEAKHRLLGVREETLARFGAVSLQTAAQMASGVAAVAHAEIGIGVTGIAGPTGGTPEKPVGLVYIGIFCKGKVTVTECHFSGDRLTVRQSSVKEALALLLRILE